MDVWNPHLLSHKMDMLQNMVYFNGTAKIPKIRSLLELFPLFMKELVVELVPSYCQASLGYSEAWLRLRSLVSAWSRSDWLQEMIEVQYKIQVQTSGYDTISFLFLELFLLLILYRVVSSLGFQLRMILSFLSVTAIGSKMFYKKGDGRFVILLVKYFSGIGGATVPDTPSPRPCGTQKVPWRVYKSRNPLNLVSTWV